MIRRYSTYLGYVLRHKGYVFRAACRLGIPWRGLVHDLSKFRPSEFLPYDRHLYAQDGSSQPRRDKTGYYTPVSSDDTTFDTAWLLL